MPNRHILHQDDDDNYEPPNEQVITIDSDTSSDDEIISPSLSSTRFQQPSSTFVQASLTSRMNLTSSNQSTPRRSSNTTTTTTTTSRKGSTLSRKTPSSSRRRRKKKKKKKASTSSSSNNQLTSNDINKEFPVENNAMMLKARERIETTFPVLDMNRISVNPQELFIDPSWTRAERENYSCYTNDNVALSGVMNSGRGFLDTTVGLQQDNLTDTMSEEERFRTYHQSLYLVDTFQTMFSKEECQLSEEYQHLLLRNQWPLLRPDIDGWVEEWKSNNVGLLKEQIEGKRLNGLHTARVPIFKMLSFFITRVDLNQLTDEMIETFDWMSIFENYSFVKLFYSALTNTAGFGYSDPKTMYNYINTLYTLCVEFSNIDAKRKQKQSRAQRFLYNETRVLKSLAINDAQRKKNVTKLAKEKRLVTRGVLRKLVYHCFSQCHRIINGFLKRKLSMTRELSIFYMAHLMVLMKLFEFGQRTEITITMKVNDVMFVTIPDGFHELDTYQQLEVKYGPNVEGKEHCILSLTSLEKVLRSVHGANIPLGQSLIPAIVFYLRYVRDFLKIAPRKMPKRKNVNALFLKNEKERFFLYNGRQLRSDHIVSFFRSISNGLLGLTILPSNLRVGIAHIAHEDNGREWFQSLTYIQNHSERTMGIHYRYQNPNSTHLKDAEDFMDDLVFQSNDSGHGGKMKVIEKWMKTKGVVDEMYQRAAKELGIDATITTPSTSKGTNDIWKSFRATNVHDKGDAAKRKRDDMQQEENASMQEDKSQDNAAPLSTPTPRKKRRKKKQTKEASLSTSTPRRTRKKKEKVVEEIEEEKE